MKLPKIRLLQSLCMLMLLFTACAPITPPVNEPVHDNEPTTVVPTNTAEESPEGNSSNPLDEAVGILVVDFYDFEVDEDQGESSNCFASPNGSTSSEGAGQSGSTGVADGVVSATILHGDWVYEHIKQQFGDGVTFVDMSPADHEFGLGTVEYITMPEGTYVLAQLNVGNHFTDKVLEQIHAARGWLQEEGVTHFVVNMSVVVKPCVQTLEQPEYLQLVQCLPTLLEQRLAINPEASLQEFDELADIQIIPHAEVAAAYYADFFAESPQTSIGCPLDPDNEEALAILESVVERSFSFYAQLVDDPLVQAFHNLDDEVLVENTIYVGASGNDGYPYPFAPALFPSVISVGAIREGGQTIGYRPNAAEWTWNDRFAWTVPESVTATIYEDGVPTPVTPGEVVTLRGTSFASAKLSYLTAQGWRKNVVFAACHPELVYAAGDLPTSWAEWELEGNVEPEAIWLDRNATQLSDEPNPVCQGFPDPSQTRPPS